MHKKMVYSIVLASYLLLYNNAFCFDDKETHPKITEKAIDSSYLDAYLKNNLGFIVGQRTTFPSNSKDTVIDLLKKSSTDEDREPSQCRASNHFHNPLIERWEYAGLSGYQGINAALIDAKCGILDSKWFEKRSNPLWATNYVYYDGPKTITSNDYDWDKTRDYYLKALTAAPKTERDHVIQDMANYSPAPCGRG